MNKLFKTTIIFFMVLGLTGCSLVDKFENFVRKNEGIEKVEEIDRSNPPKLVVTDNSKSIDASIGNYEWSCVTEDGSVYKKEQDNINLETEVSKTSGLEIKIQSTLSLNFEFEPKEISVYKKSEDGVVNTVNIVDNKIQILDQSNDGVYEIIAMFDEGIVRYSFKLNFENTEDNEDVENNEYDTEG